MSFNTVLNLIQYPRNIGMITRSHVAFGGDKLVFLGYETPWVYCKESSAYATNLQCNCDILHFKTIESFLYWSKENQLMNYAIEIGENSKSIIDFKFNQSCNLILGNEFTGLSEEVLSNCDESVVIPQIGAVACLNVAIAASITFYEFTRNLNNSSVIHNTKFVEHGK